MYLDKLDGRVTQDFFDQKSAEWRKEQEDILRKICDIQRAAPAPIDQAVDVVRTSRASELCLAEPRLVRIIYSSRRFCQH